MLCAEAECGSYGAAPHHVERLIATERWFLQVIVVGGSSVDCADGGTPASTYSYRINVAAGANHAPLQETMPAARAVRPHT